MPDVFEASMKRSPISLGDSSDEELEIVDDVVGHGSKADCVDMDTILEDLLDDIPGKAEKSPAASSSRGGRLKKGPPKKKLRKKEKEPQVVNLVEPDIEEGDNASDNDDGDAAVLAKCESLSSNMFEALKTWSGNKGGLENRDAIGLSEINEQNNNSAGGIIDHSTISALCTLPLKPYQVVGVNWLKLLHELDINGILADDMGLGKTLQTIAFLAWLKNHRTKNGTQIISSEPRTHLIVVPASTLSNWESELHRFCPQLSTFVYHGDQHERFDLRYRIKQLILNDACDILLTTYSYFSGNSKDERVFFRNRRFDYLVVDEAHALKSSNTARYINLSALQVEHKILISGTPVQNNISELVSLLAFLMPSLFRKSIVDILLHRYRDIQKGAKKGGAGAIGTRRKAPAPAPAPASGVIDGIIINPRPWEDGWDGSGGPSRRNKEKAPPRRAY